MKKMKKRKAQRKNKISNEACMCEGHELIEAMANSVGQIWEARGLPEGWKSGMIKPIYKKGT